MKFSQYIPLAARTCKSLPPLEHANHMGLGIVGEVGEIIDALKKHHIYGKPLDRANLVEELGDVCWYVANLVAMFPEPDDTDCLMELPVEKLGGIDVRNNPTVTILVASQVAATLSINFYEAVAGMVSADDGGDTTHSGKATHKFNVAKCMAMEHAAQLCLLTAEIAYLIDVPLEEAFEVNIKKLAQRYGDKYSDFNAINRDLTAERKILEEGA